MSKRVIRWLVCWAVAIGSLIWVSLAAGSTYCVPDFSAACPDDGVNLLAPSGITQVEKLQAAMSPGLLASDGEPDTIVVATGIYVASGTFQPTGSDDLTIVGNGREETLLTSSSTGNIFLLNLNNRAGEVTVRDLSLAIPASFPDGGGGKWPRGRGPGQG